MDALATIKRVTFTIRKSFYVFWS